jgi:hypothetical protein
MKKELNDLRPALDGMSKVASNCMSHEAALSLKMAKAYCGILLGTMGSKSPYKKDGQRKTVADIEPTADVANVPVKFIVGDERVGVIDNLREVIKAQIKSMETIETTLPEGERLTREGAIARTLVWTHLTNARIQLGFTLSEIAA